MIGEVVNKSRELILMSMQLKENLYYFGNTLRAILTPDKKGGSMLYKSSTFHDSSLKSLFNICDPL